MSDIDWQAVFYGVQDALWARARQRFGDSPDAESAMNHALDALSRDSFAEAGRGYSGRGSPEGFVVVKVVNLMHDYASAKYGRPRPPTWLRRLGAAWTQAFEMLCLRRQMPETIVDTLYASANLEASRARSMLREIKARIPNCGQLAGGEVAMADDAPEERDANSASLETEEATSVIGALQGVFDPDAPVPHDAPSTVALAAALSRLGQQFDLSDNDRLMLRLVYQRGLTLAKAARAMNIKDYDIRRRHARLMRHLRAALEDCGLGVTGIATQSAST